jgi:predicted nucleotidyltransferase
MTNIIRESLKKTCKLLNDHGVDYLLIGGVAVGFHGYPRGTADIDFWYNPTHENFYNLLTALKSHGIDISSLENIVFDKQRTFLRIPQFGFKTEFLPTIPGVKSFPECKKNAIKTDIDGIEVHILGYDDLIKNKETLKRPSDLLDVEELRKRRTGE